jgi:hypothetical protein
MSTSIAATFTVTRPYDSGPETLREAIMNANAAPGADTIVVTLLEDIRLASPLPLIDSDLSILNQGRSIRVIATAYNGAPAISPMLETAPGHIVTVSRLEFQGASSTPGEAAVVNRGSNMTLRKCALLDNAGISVKNTAAAGQSATLELRECTFHGLSQGVSGVDNSGNGQQSLVVTDCVFLGSNAFSAGAIHNLSTASVTNSTFSLIPSRSAILGMHNQGASATLDLRNCTLVGNASGGPGGPLLFNDGGVVTFANNIFKPTGGAASIVDTLNDPTRLRSDGHNLSLDPAGGSTSTTGPGGYLNGPGDIRNTDPLLGSFLTDNGGATQTFAVLAGSPVINKADAASAPARDQRDFIRVDAPDIGAYEYSGVVPASLGNISTRARVGTGNNVLIAGCIMQIAGQPNRIAVRAIGPSLPVAGALADPKLDVRTDAPPYGTVVASNDNWQDSPNKQEIVDLGLAPSRPAESAAIAALNQNGGSGSFSCTSIVGGVNDSTGIGLVELYELERTKGQQFLNMSTRGLVGLEDEVMIAGFIVVGPDPLRVTVRALGPSTSNFITNPLQNPTLAVYDQNGAVLAANDDWRTSAQANEIFANNLGPGDDRESATILTFQPGPYTAIVRGVNGTAGVALIELYRL